MTAISPTRAKLPVTIKKSLQRLGVAPAIIRRVSVAVYEAEMNLVIHTDVGGEIIVDVRRDRLKISAVDHGPGIENVQKLPATGIFDCTAVDQRHGIWRRHGLGQYQKVFGHYDVNV